MQSFSNYIKNKFLIENNLEDFVNFASDYLKIKEMPEIKLVNHREGHMTTANYMPKQNLMKIYAKGRAFFDIARSVAHELVHHMQNEIGAELDGNTGSPCENEANILAGIIVRKYGEKNPDFYN